MPSIRAARDRRDQRELVAVVQHVQVVDKLVIDRDAKLAAQLRDRCVALGKRVDRSGDRRAEDARDGR